MQCQPYTKDQQGTPDDLNACGFCELMPKFFGRKVKRDPHDKQKERKDHVGRGGTMPFGVQQGRVNMAPTAWCVNQDHKGNGHAPEYIKGQ